VKKYQTIGESDMGDNQQQNYGSNMTGGETSNAKKRASLIPPRRTPVLTQIGKKAVKAVESAAESIKNKNKINPGDYGS